VASRNLLHVDKLEAFRAWLEASGYRILPPRGEFEVLRWKGNPGRPMPIVFWRGAKPTKERPYAILHYTTNDAAYSYVRRFIRETRGSRGN
jgi:hypothetical protein